MKKISEKMWHNYETETFIKVKSIILIMKEKNGHLPENIENLLERYSKWLKENGYANPTRKYFLSGIRKLLIDYGPKALDPEYVRDVFWIRGYRKLRCRYVGFVRRFLEFLEEEKINVNEVFKDG